MLLDELKQAAANAMASVGCDHACKCGQRVAFATWLRLQARIDDGNVADLVPVAAALDDLAARARQTFGHDSATDCTRSEPTPSWRPAPPCTSAT